MSDFNDPFEGKFKLKLKLKHFDPDYLETKPELMGVFSDSYHRAGESYLTQEKPIERLPSEEFGHALGDYNEEMQRFADEHGAICFTSNLSNQAMWAYYGNNNKGFGKGRSRKTEKKKDGCRRYD